MMSSKQFRNKTYKNFAEKKKNLMSDVVLIFVHIPQSATCEGEEKSDIWKERTRFGKECQIK